MEGVYYFDGAWSNEQPLLSGPLDLAFWSGNTVFDGARAIAGCAPDLDLHCARLVKSASAIGMTCPISAEEVHRLCIEGLEMLPADKDYYVRPMVFCSGGSILPETGDIRFTLAIFEVPMPGENAGKATMTAIRRPAPDQAPTDAKTGALYPNSQRARRDAMARGFNLGVVCDHEGNVAEFSHANLWLAKDGVAITPTPNGSFLDGITKNRVATLLKDAGIEVVQRTVTPTDLDDADEIFMTGNMGKVQTVTGWEARELQPGPIFRAARDLYAAHVAASRVPTAGSAYRRAVA